MLLAAAPGRAFYKVCLPAFCHAVPPVSLPRRLAAVAPVTWESPNEHYNTPHCQETAECTTR